MTDKKTRGRPAGLAPDHKAEGLQVSTEKSRDEQREPKRPPRVSMQAGQKLKLHNTDLDKYHYAWIVDKDGKLEQAKSAYYEHHKEDGVNNTVRQSGPNKIYAMKLEMRYYLEDEELKNQALSDSIKKEQALGDSEYVPGAEDGRQNVLEKDAEHDPLA